MRPRRPAPRTTPPTPRPAAASAQNIAAEHAARDAAEAAAPDLKLVHGDGALGVHGQNFCVLFSYIHGGPVSLRAHGAEWLYRAPRPVFWRAATENDKACGFPVRSAAWLAADSQTQCTGVTVERESPRAVTVPAVRAPGRARCVRRAAVYRHGGRHADADGRIPRRARPARAALLRRAAHDARAAGLCRLDRPFGRDLPRPLQGRRVRRALAKRRTSRRTWSRRTAAAT